MQPLGHKLFEKSEKLLFFRCCVHESIRLKNDQRSGHCLRLIVLIGIFLSPGQIAAAETAYHLRLIDRLDRPEDGYCLDILGVGSNMRLDLPLFAHNCKPVLTSDSAVIMLPTGQIVFPAVARCITVAGVNSGALAGAAILLRACDEAGPFFETASLQRFNLQADGRVTLNGTDLCLAVGADSATTYSPQDRWRALFVERCDRIEPARSRWELVIP